MDQGSWIKDHGSRIMDQVSSIKYPVSRIKDLGPCSGMNDHPGRDTDLRSRPSESTIKDLSKKITSWMRLGPSWGASLGRLGGLLGRLKVVLESPWGRLGGVLGRLGGLLGRLGGLLVALAASWRRLDASGASSGAS